MKGKLAQHTAGTNYRNYDTYKTIKEDKQRGYCRKILCWQEPISRRSFFHLTRRKSLTTRDEKWPSVLLAN